MNIFSSMQLLCIDVYENTIGRTTQFIKKWFLEKHPPRNISRLRWKFDYYVGRNPLGTPHYGLFCVRNAYYNTGLYGFLRSKRSRVE